MKVIIPLGGLGTRMRPYTWSRPKPLLKVAGNTVIGHLLDLMSDITTGEVLFVVGYKGDEIESWIRENYPHLDAHFVIQADPLGQAHAIWLCRDFLNDEDVVVAFGDGIVEADYANLPEDADAVFLVQEVEDPRRFGVAVLDEQGYITKFVEKPKTMEHRLAIAGVYWFRSGSFLRQALDTVMEKGRMTLGEYFLADAFEVMLEEGARLRTKPVVQWADAGNLENILHTNARLLSVGYASDHALERSFAEGFTVIPPVYLHETAVVDSAVIGPYTTIDASVTIKNAVIRNSIIDREAHVENCVLDQALVGERARVVGHTKGLFVGDDSVVDLG